MRTILDLNTLKVYFLGPGEYQLSDALPDGTDCIQAERGPTGHLMMPCHAYDQNTKKDVTAFPVTSKKKKANKK